MEHADGVGLANHLVGGGVFGWNVLHRHRGAVITAVITVLATALVTALVTTVSNTVKRIDRFERAANRRQHAERQHIDLEEMHRVQIILVPLDHSALGHGGVFHRYQLVQGAARNHEAPNML